MVGRRSVPCDALASWEGEIWGQNPQFAVMPTIAKLLWLLLLLKDWQCFSRLLQVPSPACVMKQFIDSLARAMLNESWRNLLDSWNWKWDLVHRRRPKVSLHINNHQLFLEFSLIPHYLLTCRESSTLIRNLLVVAISPLHFYYRVDKRSHFFSPWCLDTDVNYK